MEPARCLVVLAALIPLLACASTSGEGGHASAPPQVFWVSPEDGDEALAGEEVSVSVIVSDDEDDVTGWDVVLKSDLAGTLGTVHPDRLGRVAWTVTLDEGEHLLTAEVVDSDGQSAASGTAFIVRGTTLTPPIITLNPAVPVTGDALEAVVTNPAYTSDGSPFDTLFQWWVDDVATGYAVPTIPAGIVHDGEVWTVRVTAYAGGAEAPVVMHAVTVGNAPPTVGGGRVELDAGGTELVCAVEPPVDPEADPIRLRYSWTLGGEAWPDDLATRPLPEAPRGTLVGCTAHADDGHGHIVDIATQPYALPNHAPTGSVAIGPAEPRASDTPSCDVTAADPDGDQVSLTFVWHDAAGSVQGEGQLFPGLVRRGGTLVCAVTLSDGVGGNTTLESLPVVVVNSPPSAPTVEIAPAAPVVGDTLECVQSVPAADVDGDALHCETTWSLLAPVSTGDTFDTRDLAAGSTVTCSIRCDDGLDAGSAGASSVVLVDPPSSEADAADAMAELRGSTDGGEFGAGLATVADVDGDGQAELLVGAPRTGAAFLFTSAVLREASLLADTDAEASFLATGADDDFGETGTFLSSGDLDGDGADDLVLAAPHDDSAGTDAGQAYVLYGGSAFGLDTPISTAATWTVQGEPGDWLGSAVAGGDLDGDGLADLVLTGPASDVGGRHAGSAAVFFGASTRPTGPLDLSDADALVVGAAAGDQLGWSAGVCADSNGDGIAELALGAPRAGSLPAAGLATLTNGTELGGFSTIDEVAWLRVTGTAAGDRLGSAVVCPGDVDADGLGDLFLGVPRGDLLAPDAGEVVVIFGTAAGDTTLAAEEADARLSGPGASSWTGAALAAAGDLDGDGTGDVLVGAPQAGSGAGLVAFLFASAAGDWTPDGGGLDTTIGGGAVGDELGQALAGGLDLTGDGFPEVALGAPGAGQGGSVFVLTGRSSR